MQNQLFFLNENKNSFILYTPSRENLEKEQPSRGVLRKVFGKYVANLQNTHAKVSFQ